MLTITHSKSHDIFLVKIEGEIETNTLGQMSETLEPMILATKEGNNVPGIILDLGKVSFIGSGGFGYFCAKHVALKKKGKRLLLTNPSKRVWNMFTRANLEKVLHFYPDRTSALSDLIESKQQENLIVTLDDKS